MKNIAVLIISFFLFGMHLASKAENITPDAKTPKAKKNVLVIGLKEGGITSNYYNQDNIAEKTLITKDSLEETFSKLIIDKIKQSNNSEFNFITLENKSSSLLNEVQYKYEKEMKVSDLSDFKDEDYQKLLKDYDAEYVIFLDNYYLKYEGGSNLFHIFNYNIYNHDKINILSGKSFFNTPELMPLANYDKKYEKSGDRIVEQLQKIDN